MVELLELSFEESASREFYAGARTSLYAAELLEKIAIHSLA
jgi:hypothetical protein